MDKYRHLIFISITAIVYFILNYIFGFFISAIGVKQNTYLIGTIILFSILMLHICFSKQNYRIQYILITALEITLLVFGCINSLSDAHNRLAVMLITLYIIVPILFADCPIKIITIIVLIDIGYLMTAYKMKDFDIFSVDFINVITYSSLGLIIGCRITKIRYERYSYEISLAKLADERYKISNIDEPTGLLNRRAFQQKTFEIKDKVNNNINLIMFDINGLKATNDNFGHLAGNQIISGAADCISGIFKDNSYVFRYGGDEFVVIYLNTKSTLIEKLQNLELKVKEWNKNSQYKLSVSYGVSSWNQSEPINFDRLLEEADNKMYFNKTQYYEKMGISRRIV